MQKMNNILNLLDPNIALLVSGLNSGELMKINELRLRKGQPLCAVVNGKSYYIGNSPYLQKTFEKAYICSDSELQQSFMGITRHSVYAYENQIAGGFITLPDGNRAGISGSFSYTDGQYRLNDIYSICIRIAREHKGCADTILPYLYKDNRPRSTLIVSPPGGGKTSILREMARMLSLYGKRVCIVDERGELAGLHGGTLTLNIGVNTDVISGCSKENGIVMACRSLCPDAIVFDEIGTVKEAYAVRNALNCGVAAIMSVHAESLEEAFSRQQIKPLLNSDILDIAVLLCGAQDPGKIRRIYSIKDEKHEDIHTDNSFLYADRRGVC